MAGRKRIDIHARHLPDLYRGALQDRGHDHPDGFQPLHIDAVRTLAPSDHLHYGGDWPFTPEEVVADGARRLDHLSDELRANTERPFPTRGHA